MSKNQELGSINPKVSKTSLSQLRVVSTPQKNIFSLFEGIEKSEYAEMINRLNALVFDVFKKGAMESGFTFAMLHYTFLTKEGAEREVGLSILKNLLVTYFQTFNSPYLFSVFLHSYIMRWFRLLVLLEVKTHEFLGFMHFDDEIWNKRYLRIYTLLDHPFKIFPNINPDNPIIPFINIDDQAMLDDLIKSNKSEPIKIGKNFAKFYHINLARILKGQENLKYIFELQSMLGPKLAIELNKKEIAEVIEGIADFYFDINKKYKEILIDFDKDLHFQKINFMVKKWIGDTRFSGILFSTLVKERLDKK